MEEGAGDTTLTMEMWGRNSSCLGQEASSLQGHPQQFTSTGETDVNWLGADYPCSYQFAPEVSPPAPRDPWTSVRLVDFAGRLNERDVDIFQKLWEEHQQESQREWSQLHNQDQVGHEGYKALNSDCDPSWSLNYHCQPQPYVDVRSTWDPPQYDPNTEAEWTLINSHFPGIFTQKDTANQMMNTVVQGEEQVSEEYYPNLGTQAPAPGISYPSWEAGTTMNSDEGCTDSYWPNERQDCQWAGQQSGQMSMDPQFMYSTNSNDQASQDQEFEPGSYYSEVNLAHDQQLNQLPYQYSSSCAVEQQQNGYLQSEIVTSSSGYYSPEVYSGDGQSEWAIDSGRSTFSYSEESYIESIDLAEDSCSSGLPEVKLTSEVVASAASEERQEEGCSQGQDVEGVQLQATEESFPTIDFEALAELGFITAQTQLPPPPEEGSGSENASSSSVGNRKYLPYTCPISGCGQSYLVNEDYREHLKSHSGDKNFECNVCHLRFWRSIELSHHIKQHVGEKPYKCADCEEWFDTKYQRTTHSRVHSKGVIFKCELCQKTCSSKHGLDLHLLTHSSSAPDLPCGFCEAVFKNQGVRTRHYNKCHSSQDAQSPNNGKKKRLTRTRSSKRPKK